ncbi:MAG TPA: hypothetical protein VK168_10300 [Saprospiraceae bacterium]|nr:hypothetical protein [Saprospiraceae bacterium]
MEENLHEDKLDDYVRKSFEEYEEAPPSDMWDRVTADLGETPERVPLWISFRNMGWQLLAAGVILVLTSTLVCEHLYYEAQIQELSEVQAKNAEQMVSAAPMEVIPSNPPQSIVAQSPSIVSQTPSTVHRPPSTVHRLPSTVSQTPSTGTPDSSNLAEQPARLSLQTIPVELGQLPSVGPSMPELESNLVATQPPAIRPAKTSTGWYAGVETSMFYRLEKEHQVSPRSGRPVFTSEATGTPITSIYWLKFGKQWENRWSLESGLGYQQTTRFAVHRPVFRFGDGTHSGMGPRRNFNYDLNTSSGTAEVSLRMEQTQPGNPSDDEPVSLRIETTESTQWIRIPVLLGYQWGERRWKGFVQTGLLANMVVRNQLNIAARVSENARFKPVDGQDGYTINLSQKRFIPGYWLGAGIGYQLGQHLQIQAEVCLSGDFPRNDVYRRRLPERYLTGVNLGLRYYF